MHALDFSAVLARIPEGAIIRARLVLISLALAPRVALVLPAELMPVQLLVQPPLAPQPARRS